eukprot:g26029.t1
MSELLKRWHDLESFCSGCSNHCGQKCVIDNHEVEIIQGPVQAAQPVVDCCHSFRADRLSSTSSGAATAKLLGRRGKAL